MKYSIIRLNYLFLLLFIVAVLPSCLMKKMFEETKTANSITAYEEFLMKYPESKYTVELRPVLNSLYEEKDWSYTLRINTVEGFRGFISHYPESRHVRFAEQKISKIEIDNAWYKTKTLNTVFAYENFIIQYPNSEYVIDAKNRINSIKDETEWLTAINIGTVGAYKDYLNNYPFGFKKDLASVRIFELETIQPDWDKTLKINTLEGYRNFIQKYPNSTYTSLAEDKLMAMDEKEWESAVKSNSIKKFKQYIKNHPEGIYIVDAEKRLIDLEVDEIFRGNYGKLPPLTKTSTNYHNSTHSELKIFNNTQFTLTLRYSGIESKKLVFSPKQTLYVKLMNGKYRVAASVNVANINNYAGEEQLYGSKYESEYYIVTSRY